MPRRSGTLRATSQEDATGSRDIDAAIVDPKTYGTDRGYGPLDRAGELPAVLGGDEARGHHGDRKAE